MNYKMSDSFPSETAPAKRPIFSAIYARTSSPNQKENYSIGQQIGECSKFSERRGWKVKYVFVDECLSAKDTDRPKFQLMLEKAKDGEFGIILFWKLDRFARSLVDSVSLQKSLKSYGVELASVTEFLDTSTPVGRFNFRNLASVAELEREIIGERARLGMYALAREHRWPNKHPPMGYKANREGRLVVDRTGAKTVLYIYQQYLASRSMPQVAFLLNMNGVKPPRGGQSWTAASVRKVLTNRLYIGEYSVAGNSEHLDELRIVTAREFEHARRNLSRYKRLPSKRRQMPSDRKAWMLDRVSERYEAFLIANAGAGKR